MADKETDRDNQKPGAQQKQAEAGAANVPDSHGSSAWPDRKSKVQQTRPTVRALVGLTNNHLGLEAVHGAKESRE